MRHFVGSFCVLFVFSFAVLAQEQNWSQFRGPNSNNHSFSTGIAESWSEGGPKLLWKINTVGAGYSNFSFYGDLMFSLGDIGDQCFLLALDRKTGEEKWRAPVGRAGDGGGGYIGPRSTPACDGETVYAMGQFSDFIAVDIRDGKERWRKNLQREFGAAVMSGWGFCTSPILDGDKVLIAIGGEGGTLGAFTKAGALLWRSTDLKDPVGYTSVVPVEIGGVRQYMLLTNASIAGISAADGKVLWRAGFPGATAVCSDPVLCGDVVMASCSYNVGAYFYRISKEGNNFSATVFREADQRLSSHHGGI
ncbi:MAG: PQQ-like beta-propeller repeat protein, partial [Planctomycetaceae bacterium]|nr:PQQ-like beta-propeller repeat protein [Planctomycetaceae bacterium]